MKKFKYKIEYITRKEIKDLNFFKQSIFNGNIYIFKKSLFCLDLIKLTNKFFYLYFGLSIDDFIKEDNPTSFKTDKLIEFQKKIKNSQSLIILFCKLLKELQFDVQETLSDKITFRYSPDLKNEAIGILKPSKAHRDTWASNVFNQINWWIPLHNVQESNSIFIVPDYFDKKISNNSDKWSFKKYKKFKNYSSTPYSEFKFKENHIKRFELHQGDVLLFSGNHIHGSILGKKKRINLETRTIGINDEKRFNLPNNIDSKSKEKKIKWFSPLIK